MEKALDSFPWRRAAVALVMTLLVLIIALPRAEKPLTNHTTSPPTKHVEGRLLQGIIAFVGCLPLICILLLGRRWPSFEVVGWIVLGFFFVGALFH